MTSQSEQAMTDSGKKLQSKPGPPMPLDDGRPCTMEIIIEQLSYHRETHTEWADWFEANPDDPRATQQFGNAAFHRKVERHYTQMIYFLSVHNRSQS